ARVIDLWGAPIPRLYAAGEVAGGIHGMARVGGDSTAAATVFGRIAGAAAAAQPPLARDAGA
ncbi:MAG: FAD-binding protein, partial [Proteobacteria bacterium]|nr:FAD-binding protein [Pseudomonadota bacterium]